MLYPVNMDQHGPARSKAEYLEYLYAELAAAARPIWYTARVRDLLARIRGLEDELGSGEPL
jgi:hypothetical protein